MRPEVASPHFAGTDHHVMLDVERRLNTLRQATRAWRYTPGKRGRVVTIERGGDVLVGGDLHGNLGNFRKLLDIADLARQPRRHFVLQELVHGPLLYPGGGDKSHQLVDLMAALKVQYPDRIHYLIGNHELSQATGRRVGKEDSGVQNDLFRAGIVEAFDDRADDAYALYLELFAAAPLAVRTANRVLLTHSMPSAPRLSCFNPDVLDHDTAPEAESGPGGSIYALVWGRDVSREAANAFLNVMNADLLITGHIPCERGFDFPNDRQVILDSLGERAGYCLFPTDRPLTIDELRACVGTV